jgi:hypothetical protein
MTCLTIHLVDHREIRSNWTVQERVRARHRSRVAIDRSVFGACSTAKAIAPGSQVLEPPLVIGPADRVVEAPDEMILKIIFSIDPDDVDRPAGPEGWLPLLVQVVHPRRNVYSKAEASRVVALR